MVPGPGGPSTRPRTVQVDREVWIRALRGVAWVFEHEGFVHIRRFPQDVYRRLEGAHLWLLNASSAAGVRLALKGAPRLLRLRGRAQSCRTPRSASFALRASGSPGAETLAALPAEDGPFEISFAVPEGLNGPFEVLFPQTHVVALSQIEADGPIEPDEDVPAPIVFIGDSITQGLSLSSPLEGFSELSARSLGTNPINLGIAGVVAIGYPLFAGTPPPRAGVVCLGINDWDKGLAPEPIAELAELWSEHHKRPVVLVLPPLWPEREGRPNLAGKTLEAFRQDLERSVRGETTIVPLDGLPTEKRFYADRHPLAPVHETLARAVAQALESVLAS